MKLIRYMELQYGIPAIKTGEFKHTSPLATNDPYEMMGACTGKCSDEVKQGLLDDMRYKWIAEGLKPGKNPPPLEDVLQRASHPEGIIRNIVFDRRIQEQHSKMLCFLNAEHIDHVADQLMWGHYAKGGKGIRIWFDDERFARDVPSVSQVSYSDKRPIIDLGTLNSYDDGMAWARQSRATMLTKSIAWSYENEYRMLVIGNKQSDRVFERDGMHFIRLPIESMTRVDFGPMGDIEETKKLVSELRDGGCAKHIDIRVATFRSEDYAYDYDSVDKLLKYGIAY